MKLYRLLPVILVGVALWLQACQTPADPSPRATQTPEATLGLAGPSLDSYELIETISRGLATLTIYTNLVHPDHVLKIETIQGIRAEDAKALVKDGVMGVEALYAQALSPYPEDLSRKIVSNPAFNPRLIQPADKDAFPYILLYANDRMGYGATSREAIRYKSLVGWHYCPATESLHKVRFFHSLETPDTKLQEAFRAIECQ